MRIFFVLLLLASCLAGSAQELGREKVKEDFDYFIKTLRQYYAYTDALQSDWNRIDSFYRPGLDTIRSGWDFTLFLEKILVELSDHHASLNTNTAVSPRLVPSGADIWAVFEQGRAVVKEVRKDFGAEKAGIRPGMEIIAFNGQPVAAAIQEFLPKSTAVHSAAARDFALRQLLAGRHHQERIIKARRGKDTVTFFPDRPVNYLKEHQYNGLLEARLLGNGTGYIRINNSLGDNALIKIFDSVLQSFAHTKALILDLRETPGGGNTTVARAIMGRFIAEEFFYQVHTLPAEEKAFGVKRKWKEMVAPRLPIYQKPLVVLCNHWTGSVGEAIVIGFDAMKRGTIVGTSMAGLKGANYSFRLPNSGIGFSFPAEQLDHVNGMPRHHFVPAVKVDLGAGQAQDPFMERALELLKIKTGKKPKGR